VTRAPDADILIAAQSLRVPGQGERRVLPPASVQRLAEERSCARWELEARALELDVVPLHFLRNLARFSMAAQIRLLRSRVTLIGTGALAIRLAESLAEDGVGRLRVFAPLQPASGEPLQGLLHEAAVAVAVAARNRNASTEASAGVAQLRSGNPVQTVADTDVVAACLEDAVDEQLLEVACRRAGVPLVLGAAADEQGQALTVLPGDRGVALLYRSREPHLAANRAGIAPEERAALVVSSWLAEQVRLLLIAPPTAPELLRGRVRYLDLTESSVEEFTL
jgi:hypothetical protein